MAFSENRNCNRDSSMQDLYTKNIQWLCMWHFSANDKCRKKTHLGHLITILKCVGRNLKGQWENWMYLFKAQWAELYSKQALLFSFLAFSRNISSDLSLLLWVGISQKSWCYENKNYGSVLISKSLWRSLIQLFI